MERRQSNASATIRPLFRDWRDDKRGVLRLLRWSELCRKSGAAVFRVEQADGRRASALLHPLGLSAIRTERELGLAERSKASGRLGPVVDSGDNGPERALDPNPTVNKKKLQCANTPDSTGRPCST